VGRIFYIPLQGPTEKLHCGTRDAFRKRGGILPQPSSRIPKGTGARGVKTSPFPQGVDYPIKRREVFFRKGAPFSGIARGGKEVMADVSREIYHFYGRMNATFHKGGGKWGGIPTGL